MAQRGFNMGTKDGLQGLVNEWNEAVENARADLLEHDEEVMLEALILNNVIDYETGKLTDYWMNLLNPKLKPLSPRGPYKPFSA